MTMTNNSLRVGMVLTCKNDNKYVVVADDNGHHDVINLANGLSNGIEVGTGKIAVCGGNGKDGRDVVKIEEFQAVPTRNRLSEALKFMTGRAFTERLTTIWVAEDPAVTAAKKAVEDATATLKAAEAALAQANARAGF